jgi:hypothetical protein
MTLMFADRAIVNTSTNPGPESMSIGPDITVRAPGAQRSPKSMHASPVPPSRGRFGPLQTGNVYLGLFQWNRDAS